MPRLLLLVLVIPVLALAAGCGGDTDAKNAYVAKTNRAVTTFEDRFMALQADFTATSTPKQDLRTLDGFRSAVDTAVARLRAIKPPSEVAELHRRLIAAVVGYETVIDEARNGFASSDPRRIITARTRFSTSLTRVTETITAAITSINARLRD